MQNTGLSFIGTRFLPAALLLVCACGTGATTGGTQTGGASSSSSGGTSNACPLSADVKALLEETLYEMPQAAWVVGSKSETAQYGYAVHIPGSPESFVGFVPMVNPCPNMAEVTKCKSVVQPSSEAFWQAHDACVRYRCEKGGNNIALVDTFFTMQPKKDANDRHAFTYETDIPAGTASFDPNPFITWRLDLTDPSAVIITAQLENAAKITPSGNDFIEFTHTGSIEINRTDADISLIDIKIDFASLLGGMTPLSTWVQVDATGNVNGEIKGDSKIYAFIKGDIQQQFTFDWQDACAQPSN